MIAHPTGPTRRFGTRALALAALALQAWCALAILAMHGLQPELDVTQHRIGEYVLGPFGGIMTSGFIAVTVSTALLLLGLLRDGPRTWPARWAQAFLWLAILGLAVSAVVPMDTPGGALNMPGLLHDVGRILYLVSSIAAASLLTLSFDLDLRWHPVRGLSLLLSLALVIEAALVARSVLAHEPWGIVNRLYALTSIGWSSCTAFQLWAVARS